MEIIKLNQSGWEIYKNLTLEFLQNEPLASSYSYDDESKMDDSKWQEIFQELLEKEAGIVLVAKEQDKYVGIIIGKRSEEKKMRHVGFISRFYVDEGYRGQGVGKKLFSELLILLENNPEIIKLNLDVTTTQITAINLYKSFGFEIIGEFKKEYLIEGKLYDIYEMEKYLSRAN